MTGGSSRAIRRPRRAFCTASCTRSAPATGAVVHLHSTHSVAVSCLAEIDPEDVLPPITAYYVMRVGRLPLVPYFRPGDLALAEAVRGFAGKHHAVLLANHGPVVAGSNLDAAVNAIEELEETAKLYLLLRGAKTRYLTPAQVRELHAMKRLYARSPPAPSLRSVVERAGRAGRGADQDRLQHGIDRPVCRRRQDRAARVQDLGRGGQCQGRAARPAGQAGLLRRPEQPFAGAGHLHKADRHRQGRPR